MQSSRVCWTISMIVRTPRPSSPTSVPHVSNISISLDAFDRSPSLSFRRWIRMGFRVPSGRQRGTKKQLRPPGATASIRNPSDIGAEQNHLWPVMRCSPPFPVGVAVVVFARTSEPPCFSVIAMPKVTPALPSTGRFAGSYVREVMRGSHSAARSGWCRSAGTTEYVIEIGHMWPPSTWYQVMTFAARAT